ncbi:MAG: hypothetical protein ABRQ38_08830 [Candidatus Eremiobacterota bacterium]
MIKRTSEQFSGEHKIYGRYPLLKDQKWRVNGITYGNTRDIIDINRDCKENFTKEEEGFLGLGSLTCKTTEPSIGVDYDDIVRLAKQANTEVVTEDDIGDIQSFNSKMKVSISLLDGLPSNVEISKENIQSIKKVAKEINPFQDKNENAKYAIDIKTQDFLIYEGP